MLCYLKLGGALITNKDQPYSVNYEVLNMLVGEIVQAKQNNRSLQLVIGHGSGSFGHEAAMEYPIHEKLPSSEKSRRFQKIWVAARKLHQIVLDEMLNANLHVYSFPPSAMIVLDKGELVNWDRTPIDACLDKGAIPIIYGDVVFDRFTENKILSTEMLFFHLSKTLPPDLILICGKEPGVWRDYPKNTELVRKITPESFCGMSENITTSEFKDVTGGMATKIQLMVDIVEENPKIEARIFSGYVKGNLIKALDGKDLGTLISVR